jgi:tetratricopeptide (TPR) repeat protein
MRITTLLVIAFIVYASAASFASESSAGQGLVSGIALVESGKYAEAATVLRKVVSDMPEDPEANYYLGVALNRLADKDAEIFLKKSLMLAPDSAATNLELGEVYFNKKIYAEAADYFENTQMLAPGSDYARKAEEFLRKMNKRKVSRWDIDILAGLQYDSNVIVNGNDLPVPAGFSRKADWRGVLGLKANYMFFGNEKFEFKGGYSLYQSLHTKLDEFNVTQNLANLTGSYLISPTVKFTTAYSYEYLILGGHQYDDAHNIAPSLIFDVGRWGSTKIGYRYNTTSFKNSGLFVNNSDRSGDNHLCEIIHTIPVAKTLSVWASYAHDENMARTGNWDYHGDKALAGLRTALPFDLTSDVYGEYYQRSYGGIDPAFGITRDDQQYSAALTLARKITENISLVLNETYTRNHSNISIFNYERSITGLFMNVRFYE